MVDATIGASMNEKKEEIENKEVTLKIWDIAGNERYDSLTSIYYRKADAVIICYEVTRRDSFDKAWYWLQEVLKTEKDCKIYLCETKMDLVVENKCCREVDITTTMALAEAYKVLIFKISSKTGENIEQLDRTPSMRRGCYLM
ncbi:hypothetical protein CHS0354_006090 [Potamilus streckersoni]|uniref:Ras-related protein Rab-24 n=1 Tax=Potamilus streckersoni TaxID=2493646 RepID=A0AAE0W275_9BIVA|nr:hypothetical protein CHS0354_006090 [Potamilus streckersoni]